MIIRMMMITRRMINMRLTAASASITRPLEPQAQAAHVPIQIHHHHHHHPYHDDDYDDDNHDDDDGGRLSQGQV